MRRIPVLVPGILILPILSAAAVMAPGADPGPVGVGAEAPPGAVVLFDGTRGPAAAREELRAKWIDWRDWPRGHAGENWRASIRNASPAGFEIAPDPGFPADTNRTTLRAVGKTAPPGRWGYDDIEARPEYRHGDARVHVEWIALDPEANSGVYLQNRYEIQILSAEKPPGVHGAAALVDEHAPSAAAGRPNGQWQSYDVVFRAARWRNGRMTEPARMSVWWNGVLVHVDRKVRGVATGLRNTSGEPVDSTWQPLKLQYEAGEVRFRNVWMRHQ
jgi:hypothetical protein